MKRITLLFALLTIAACINAQHDFDNQGIIYKSGDNIGIGTNLPTDLLHIRNNSTNFIRKGEIKFSPGFNGVPEGGAALYNWIQSSYYNNSNWDLGLGGDDYNGQTPLMMILGSGKVGIGTLTPSKNLEVFGQNTSELQLSTGGSSYNLTLEANYDAANRWHLKSNGSGVLGNVSLVGTTPTYVRGHNGVAFLSGSGGVNDGNVRMFIKSNGNVGVGTADPNSSFEVSANSVNTFKVINPNSASGSISRFYNDADRGAQFISYGSTYSAGSYFGTGQNNGALAFNQPTTIGTVTNDDFKLGANGVAKMTISKSGNIGIGTDVPSTQFTVENPGLARMLLETTSANHTSGILFKGRRSTGATSSHYLGTSGVSNYDFEINADERFFIKTNSTERILITGSGNVGIGTTMPSELLTVNGTSKSQEVIVDDYSPRIYLKRNTSTGGYIQGIQSQFADGSDNWFFGNSENAIGTAWRVNKGTYNSPALLFLHESGHLGLGTMTLYSDYKLSVAGKGQFEEVKVHPETQWMDIVFEEDYDLRSLQEVKKYIEENGHLPDIPSAEDVAENGFNLGEMDANLLRKIEELTLYSISKEEEVDRLNGEIENLKKNVEVLNLQFAKTDKLESELEELKQLMFDKK